MKSLLLMKFHLTLSKIKCMFSPSCQETRKTEDLSRLCSNNFNDTLVSSSLHTALCYGWTKNNKPHQTKVLHVETHLTTDCGVFTWNQQCVFCGTIPYWWLLTVCSLCVRMGGGRMGCGQPRKLKVKGQNMQVLHMIWMDECFQKLLNFRLLLTILLKRIQSEISDTCTPWLTCSKAAMVPQECQSMGADSLFMLSSRRAFFLASKLESSLIQW